MRHILGPAIIRNGYPTRRALCGLLNPPTGKGEWCGQCKRIKERKG